MTVQGEIWFVAARKRRTEPLQWKPTPEHGNLDRSLDYRTTSTIALIPDLTPAHQNQYSRVRVAYATAAQVITIANTGPLSEMVDPSLLVLLCVLKFRVFISLSSVTRYILSPVLFVGSIQWPFYIPDYITSPFSSPCITATEGHDELQIENI